MVNINIFTVCFLVLFTAKVFGYISISWWLVILPLLIPAIFVGLFLGMVLVLWGIDYFMNRY